MTWRNKHKRSLKITCGVFAGSLSYMQLSTFVPCSASYPTDTVNLLSPASWNRMDRQPTEGVTAYSMAVPGNNILFGSSTILLQTEKQSPLNASSNTNGNANTVSNAHLCTWLYPSSGSSTVLCLFTPHSYPLTHCSCLPSIQMFLSAS